MFNEICINEEMLLKYTHTHIHIYIYIYIYICHPITTAKTKAAVPTTMVSSDDKLRVNHGFKAKASLSLTRGTSTVTIKYSQALWVLYQSGIPHPCRYSFCLTLVPLGIFLFSCWQQAEFSQRCRG